MHCLKVAVYSRNIAYSYTPNDRAFLCIVTEFIVVFVRHFTITLGRIMTSVIRLAVQFVLPYHTR